MRNIGVGKRVGTQQNINSGLLLYYLMDHAAFELSLVSAEVRSEVVQDSCTYAQHRLSHLNNCAQILMRKMKRLLEA